jgi:hypothetical protein
MLMNAVKWGSFVKTHVIDVNTSRTPEVGAKLAKRTYYQHHLHECRINVE